MALDKTTLYAAVISGGFALVGTAITGYFSYKSSQHPNPAPIAPPVMSAIAPAPLSTPAAPPTTGSTSRRSSG